MSPSLTKALRPLLLIVASLLMLACSRIDLAYRNLDVLVPWSLGDYLDMNREQKNWLDQRLKQHLAWHCQTQLHEMREAFSEDIRKRQAEYVDIPLARQIDRRAERMEKRLKPWLGELNAEQRVRVMAWSQALGEQNRQWIANRAHWQQQLSLALDQRHDASFGPRLAQLLQHKERLWTPQYRAAFQNTEAQARSLVVDLMRQSSPAQRQFLQDRLSKVRADFSGMKCLKG
jgi:hypothetical protein